MFISVLLWVLFGFMVCMCLSEVFRCVCRFFGVGSGCCCVICVW